MSNEKKIFSLGQVATSIKKTLEERYQQFYWVKAEMHKLNLYPSGHAFPELVEKKDGKIIAQLNGTIWKHNLQKINQQFVTVLKEPLKEGTTLLLQVKITYSEIFGINLQIIDIDTNYSLGELQRERQETLVRLQKEGLINANQKLAFPLLPQRVAIISADTSKGLSDFLKVIQKNNFGYQYFTYLFPSALQGDAAIEGIMKQLARIEKVKHHFDIVVIVRGGGGEVGMACYNNYALCKAIATCSLPVLTGIGHSTNLTVAEMIAFRNAITPTELGEFLLQAFHNVSVPLNEAVEKVNRISQQQLQTEQRLFSNLVIQLKDKVKHNLLEHHANWQTISRKLNAKTELVLERQKERLQHTYKSLLSGSKKAIIEQDTFLQDAQLFLLQNASKMIERKYQEVENLQKHIQLLDPKNVLKRGYSITRLNGKTVQENNLPSIGEVVEIETFNYSIKTKVEEINTQQNKEENE